MRCLLIASVLLCVACGKGGSSPGNSAKGTISLTIDGTAYTFSSGATGGGLNTGAGPFFIDLSGFQSTYGNSSELQIGVTAVVPVRLNTQYTFADTFGTSGVATVALENWPYGSEITYGAAAGTAASNDSITFTVFNSSNIQGSFSGVLIYQDNQGDVTAHRVKGTFNVPNQ